MHVRRPDAHGSRTHTGEASLRRPSEVRSRQNIKENEKKHIRRKHPEYLDVPNSVGLSDVTEPINDGMPSTSGLQNTDTANTNCDPQELTDTLCHENVKSDLVDTFSMLQLRMKYMHAVPGEVISQISAEVMQLLSIYNDCLFSDLHSSVDGCQNSDNLESLRCEYKSLLDSLLATTTVTAQDAFIKQELNYVEGEKCVLGRRNEKEDVFFYVPIIQTLESFLKHPDVLAAVKNGHASRLQNLHDFCDGSLFATNPLFSGDPCALQIQLYVDDFETLNPLGSYAKKQKLNACYFTLGNVHPMYRSKLRLIHLVWLCRTEDLKFYCLPKISSRLIADLSLLETVGICLNIDGVREEFKGTLSMIVADNLGSHGIGGFNESFSGFRICRFCMCTSQELANPNLLRKFVERTVSSYDEQATLVTDDQMKTTYGIRQNSPFNSLKYFHVANGLPSDFAHDLFEGVCPHVLGKVLTHYVVADMISIQACNDTISNFPYMLTDKSNKPSPLMWSNGCVIVKQKAAQMWCLMRLLFLLWGNIIPQGDIYWQLLIYLVEICDLAAAPVHSNESIAYLEGTVFDFLELFVMLFPGEKLKPKMHYLMHYPKQIRSFGPLSNCWTLRFEAKHSFFKQIVRTTQNKKNLLFTLTKRHQLSQAVKLSSREILGEEIQHTGGSNVSVSDLPSFMQNLLKGKFKNLDTLYSVRTIYTMNRDFVVGSFVVSSFVGNLCQFSEVKMILLENSKVYFVVQSEKTISFDQHYHSYMVKRSAQEDKGLSILTPAELLDSYALPMYNIPGHESGLSFITMKYKLPEEF
ncbi:hypothetical protein HOLleu_38047 [Holothuria leucospilota]|uniref:Uncharacterized protein n=1 Tax=Holothuria leucospilota TaxID=206669 RepID=A0A9Q0YI53_HOLLE|nr:hypothetical protein HOLleu_38047 [Holothuria leucospilota]